MWISDLSIRRPVLASVMAIILVLFGLVSLTFLSVREYPDIDPPIITVTTIYPGANADIMESSITERLEDQLIGIEGIRSMHSVSREGVSSVFIEFELERDVNVAAQDVRDRVSRARGQLPDDIEEPIIAKQDSDAQAIMWLGLSGKNFSTLQITDYADRYLKDQLQTVAGVGNVIIGGAREYAMRIWLDPVQMASRRITVLDVEKALRNENVELPSGRIEGLQREFSVRTLGEMKTPEQFNRLIIKRVHQTPVYLQDIGHAAIGPKDDRSLVRFNGEPAVGLGIVKQSKANTLDVAREVKARLPAIRAALPPGLTMDAAYDSSLFIQRSVDEVVESLFVAFGLVVLVVFLFLRNARATIIPALSIPISLIAIFTVMHALNYTINTITLLGLTLAIGLVVDDTIVVLENIHRRIEMGEPPMEAAFRGTREIGFAVIATTAVLVAVFLPILFMGGLLGRILREFAVVVAGSVIISGFVSLTLTPMLCARMLKAGGSHGGGFLMDRFLNGFYQGVEAVANAFERTLRGLIHRKKYVFGGVGLIILVCGGIYPLLPKEFLPVEDRGSLLTFINAPEGASMRYTDKAVRQAEAIYKSVPEVGKMFSVLAFGGGGPGAVNVAVMFVTLKEARHRKPPQIVASILPRMLGIPEAFVFPLSPPSTPVQGFGQPIQLAVQSSGDIHQLHEVVERIKTRASREIFGLFNVDADLKLNKPQIVVTIDRERASRLGVTVRDISHTMQILLGGLNLSTFQYNNKRYDVMAQGAPHLRLTPDQLSLLYVEGKSDPNDKNGQLIPLSSVVNYREAVAPKELNHYNRMRAATVSGAILPIPGISMGGVLEKLHAIAQEEISPGMRLAWKGEAKEFFDADSATYFAFALAVLVVFLVLAAQFESYIDPLIVMLTVPLALAGAIFTLFALSYGPMALKMLISALAAWSPPSFSLNVYSQIGLVMLVGLVTKNGILIVEFANRIREQEPERPVAQAVVEAARLRFRPIVMTSVATIFGAVPIAFGLGAGVDGRKPLGAVIIGGLLAATFLTLYVIPLVYDLIKGRRGLEREQPCTRTVD